MEDLIYYNKLYDLYKELLTDKQKEYFEYYYFDNLSLGEIAENLKVSRNAVHKQINTVKERLDFYEDTIKLNKMKDDLEKIINRIEDNKLKEEIRKIID